MTFEERGGKTLLVMHDLYPSKEALDDAIASGSTSGTARDVRATGRASRHPGPGDHIPHVGEQGFVDWVAPRQHDIMRALTLAAKSFVLLERINRRKQQLGLYDVLHPPLYESSKSW